MNAERFTTANLDQEEQRIEIRSVSRFNLGNRDMEIVSSEQWSLKDRLNVLEVIQVSSGFRGGENRTVLVYENKNKSGVPGSIGFLSVCTSVVLGIK